MNPNPNTADRIIFCRRGSLIVHTTGIGSKKMRKSVTAKPVSFPPFTNRLCLILTHMQPRIRPPHTLRMAILFGHGKIPVRLQRDTGGERDEHHVNIRGNHDPE